MCCNTPIFNVIIHTKLCYDIKHNIYSTQRCAITHKYATRKYADMLYDKLIRNITIYIHTCLTCSPYSYPSTVCYRDDARQVFPAACFQANGRIVPPQLREAHAQLGIFMTDSEFTSLWQRCVIPP